MIFFFTINYVASYVKDVTRRQTLVKENKRSSVDIEGVAIKMSSLLMLIVFFKVIILKTISGYVFFDQLIVVSSNY